MLRRRRREVASLVFAGVLSACGTAAAAPSTAAYESHLEATYTPLIADAVATRLPCRPLTGAVPKGAYAACAQRSQQLAHDADAATSWLHANAAPASLRTAATSLLALASALNTAAQSSASAAGAASASDLAAAQKAVDAALPLACPAVAAMHSASRHALPSPACGERR